MTEVSAGRVQPRPRVSRCSEHLNTISCHPCESLLLTCSRVPVLPLVSHPPPSLHVWKGETLVCARNSLEGTRACLGAVGRGGGPCGTFGAGLQASVLGQRSPGPRTHVPFLSRPSCCCSLRSLPEGFVFIPPAHGLSASWLGPHRQGLGLCHVFKCRPWPLTLTSLVRSPGARPAQRSLTAPGPLPLRALLPSSVMLSAAWAPELFQAPASRVSSY